MHTAGCHLEKYIVPEVGNASMDSPSLHSLEKRKREIKCLSQGFLGVPFICYANGTLQAPIMHCASWCAGVSSVSLPTGGILLAYSGGGGPSLAVAVPIAPSLAAPPGEWVLLVACGRGTQQRQAEHP